MVKVLINISPSVISGKIICSQINYQCRLGIFGARGMHELNLSFTNKFYNTARKI